MLAGASRVVACDGMMQHVAHNIDGGMLLNGTRKLKAVQQGLSKHMDVHIHNLVAVLQLIGWIQLLLVAQVLSRIPKKK